MASITLKIDDQLFKKVKHIAFEKKISVEVRAIGGQVLLFDILISRDERRCSSDLIIEFGLTRNELRYVLDPAVDLG